MYALTTEISPFSYSLASNQTFSATLFLSSKSTSNTEYNKTAQKVQNKIHFQTNSAKFL